jgi:class 3 adenylate cyclase
MSTQRHRLEAAINGLESQRPALGDSLVDAALAPLRAELAALAGSTAVEPPAKSLRQTTILFLDVVSSTELSQRFDPEDIYAVMDGALARFKAVIEAHQGRVLRFMGDGLLAAFGADGAREDDPERAVRAGLALLDASKLHAVEVLDRHQFRGFDVRVGIHTGTTLFGDGVEAGNTAMGMTVNIAARMEQTAPAGCLRISHDTWRQVRGLFDVQAQPPLLIKGRDEPILTYLVSGAKPRAFRGTRRGIDGVETHLVGRDRELNQLTAEFEKVIATGSMAFVTLIGDAGMGKSRLVTEFEQCIELRPERAWLYRGRAQPQGLHQPYGVLRDLLCWRFEIQDSDSLRQAQAKLADGIGGVLGEGADEQTALIGQLIGLDYSSSPGIIGVLADGKQLRQRAFRAAAQYFRKLATDRGEPVMLLLEDLHWADEGSLEFILQLAGACRDVPMLILCTTRPTLFERRAAWDAAIAAHRRIDIDPLPPEHSRELAEALLHRVGDPPPLLRDLLTRGAEGNPFYMEELTQMLIDDGAIRTEGDQWTVVGERLRHVHVPSTLTGVLQARIDGLPVPERRALQQASVIGHVFWDQALAQLQADAPLSLPALGRRELALGRDTSAFDGTREYIFKHHLLHQVTYDSVLKRHKKEQHHRTALWLEERCAGRSGEYLGLIAEHFERAGQDEHAAQYWARAADDALQRHADDAAMAHAERVLTLDPAGRDLRRRYAVMQVRQAVFSHRSERQAQAQALDEVERLADALGDDRLRSQAATSRARWHAGACDWPEALAAAQRALAAAGSSRSIEAANAHGAASEALYRLDRCDAAREHAQTGLLLARAVGDKTAQSEHLNNLGNLAMVSRSLVEAGRFYQEAAALKLQIGDRFHAATVVGNLSILAVQLGELDQAREWQSQSLLLARETGNRAVQASMHHSMAELLSAQGEPAAALVSAQEGLRIMREIGDRRQEAETLTTCGDAALAQQQWDAATEHFRAARDLFSEIDMPYWAQMPAAGLASALLAGGDMAGALHEVDLIIARLDAGIGAADKCGVLFDCHRVLEAAGDPRAEGILAAAHGEMQRTLARIDDPRQREAFLSRALHQQLLAAWAKTGAAHPTGDPPRNS